MAAPAPALDLVEAFKLAAKAVAEAGRTVATESANPHGGLAVKSARLDFQFDMMVTRDRKDAQVGLGMRNAMFGPTVITEQQREAGGNRGTISLDIVAVTQVPEQAPAPDPAPAPPGIAPKDLSAFTGKLKTLRSALAGADWPPERTARVTALIDVSEATARAGDLAGAEAVLALLAEALAAPQPAPPKPTPKPKGLRPRGQVE